MHRADSFDKSPMRRFGKVPDGVIVALALLGLFVLLAVILAISGFLLALGGYGIAKGLTADSPLAVAALSLLVVAVIAFVLSCGGMSARAHASRARVQRARALLAEHGELGERLARQRREILEYQQRGGEA